MNYKILNDFVYYAKVQQDSFELYKGKFVIKENDF